MCAVRAQTMADDKLSKKERAFLEYKTNGNEAVAACQVLLIGVFIWDLALIL